MIKKLFGTSVKVERSRQEGTLNIGTLVVLVLIVVAVGFVVPRSDDNKSVEDMTPTEIISLAMQNSVEHVKTSTREGFVELHVEPVPDGTASVGPTAFVPALHGRALFTMSADISDMANMLYKLSMVLEQSSETDTAFERAIKQLDLDMIGIGQVSYLRINKLPDMVAMFMPTLLDYQDTWFVMDPDDLAEDLVPEIEREEFLKMNAMGADPEMIEAIVEIVSNARIFDVVEELPVMELFGEDTHHYKIALNHKGIRDVVHELAKFVLEGDFAAIDQQFEATGVKKPDLAELKRAIDGAFDELSFDLSTITGEIWVATDNLVIRKSRFDVPLDVISDGTLSGSLAYQSETTSIDESVSIEAPEGATSIRELVEMFGGLLAPTAPVL